MEPQLASKIIIHMRFKGWKRGRGEVRKMARWRKRGRVKEKERDR